MWRCEVSKKVQECEYSKPWSMCDNPAHKTKEDLASCESPLRLYAELRNVPAPSLNLLALLPVSVAKATTKERQQTIMN